MLEELRVTPSGDNCWKFCLNSSWLCPMYLSCADFAYHPFAAINHSMCTAICHILWIFLAAEPEVVWRTLDTVCLWSGINIYSNYIYCLHSVRKRKKNRHIFIPKRLYMRYDLLFSTSRPCSCKCLCVCSDYFIISDLSLSGPLNLWFYDLRRSNLF